MDNHAVVITEADDDKKEETCCWGIFRTNVEQGALIIACLGIMFNLLGVFVFFLPISEVNDPWMGVAAILYIFPCICVIIALRRREPRFFLPYLIFGIAEIVFYCADMLVSIWFAFASPDSNVQKFRKEHTDEYDTIEQAKKGYQISQGSEAATLFVGIAVTAWFYSVIWSAFNVMHRQHSQGRMRLSEISA